MNEYFKNGILSIQNKLFDELYNTTTLVNVTKNCCQEREFKGEYYGIPKKFIHHISNERNEYISLLTLISDKIKSINTINLNIEKEISYLHEDTNNSCR